MRDATLVRGRAGPGRKTATPTLGCSLAPRSFMLDHRVRWWYRWGYRDVGMSDEDEPGRGAARTP